MKWFHAFIIGSFLISCQHKEGNTAKLEVYQSSAAGDLFKKVPTPLSNESATVEIKIDSTNKLQTILGFGGAFTESSAHLFQQLSKENQKKLIEAYFGDEGAAYSICRTHINSCDFSLDYYDYLNGEEDSTLSNFNLEEDLEDVIPFIRAAQKGSTNGFKIIASPWTAPPWMKDNNSWEGGKLLEEHYSTWANYFIKYLKAYEDEGIPIWGITVENEPLGNNENWESMHFSPEEMYEFVKEELGPKMRDHFPEKKILMYDQNRGEELIEWSNVVYKDEELAPYVDGMAIHWYSSTVDPMTESIDYTHDLAPEKLIIQSEACIDNDVPVWKDDQWYWSKEATDWGFEWAKDENKYLHPKYVPVYRYASDIIATLNHWTNAWIDWNMILDRQGGPNHAENWCIAPVIVDVEADEVYFTPLYYTVKHFSRYIKEGAQRIDMHLSNESIMATAVQNADGSIVVILLNQEEELKNVGLAWSAEKRSVISMPPSSIQTILIN